MHAVKSWAGLIDMTYNLVLASKTTMATTVCRLCREVVSCRNTIHLFSAKGLSNKWASRISSLLEVSVDEDERISPQVCSMCTRRVVSLEKAAVDLQSFRELAQCSLTALQSAGQSAGPLKRTRVTSGEVGVSPDTARARPSSKLSRRQLSFQCKHT